MPDTAMPAQCWRAAAGWTYGSGAANVGALGCSAQLPSIGRDSGGLPGEAEGRLQLEPLWGSPGDSPRTGTCCEAGRLAGR